MNRKAGIRFFQGVSDCPDRSIRRVTSGPEIKTIGAGFALPAELFCFSHVMA